MRIKEIITKGELRPVLKQFLPTSTVRKSWLCLGNLSVVKIYIIRPKPEPVVKMQLQTQYYY